MSAHHNLLACFACMVVMHSMDHIIFQAFTRAAGGKKLEACLRDPFVQAAAAAAAAGGRLRIRWGRALFNTTGLFQSVCACARLAC